LSTRITSFLEIKEFPVMPLQKPHDENAPLKNKHKPSKPSKILFAAVMLLVILILQRILMMPLPVVAAHSQMDSIGQRATLPPEWTATSTAVPALVQTQIPLPTITLGGIT
jgi:hypothetical protein